MRIVVVSAFYSPGMGYTENCLPKYLASLGHEVHVIASNYNVYGLSSEYSRTYQSFLGSADQGEGAFEIDGYIVHRLKARILSGYIFIPSLVSKVRSLSPDVVHSTEIASLLTYQLALCGFRSRFKLFTETHQHMSVMKPYMRESSGNPIKRLLYRLTRTLPTHLASHMVEKCYAIAPDCLEVAEKFYAVPKRKLVLQPLGTDTEMFRPALDELEVRECLELRREIGILDTEILCIYTGRFSDDKNPLLLAKAIESISADDPRYRGVFIGEGVQREDISRCRNCIVLPFMRHDQLSRFYRMSNIAVWPRQESMSMLDAAASGLPLVTSHRLGELDRVQGSGYTYEENCVESLKAALLKLGDPQLRSQMGAVGRKKTVERYSWQLVAQRVERDYRA